jgi:class 3 adenylate cyclase
MQQAIREHASERAAAGRPTIEARVGVNTGEVVVRTIETDSHAEYAPIGMTAHLAARLQVVAPSSDDLASIVVRARSTAAQLSRVSRALFSDSAEFAHTRHGQGRVIDRRSLRVRGREKYPLNRLENDVSR